MTGAHDQPEQAPEQTEPSKPKKLTRATRTPPDSPNPSTITRRRLLQNWWVLPVVGTFGAFGFMGWYATRVTFGKRRVGPPQFQAGPSQKITSLSALAQDWAEQPFSYAGRPCVLLRLPAPTPGGLTADGGHYAAFSRVCTHLGCTVNLVRDPEILAFAFNYRPPHDQPELGCRCHFSVFDPLAGGEAVFGKATAPLPRVRLELRGEEIYATGIEAAPATSG